MQVVTLRCSKISCYIDNKIPGSDPTKKTILKQHVVRVMRASAKQNVEQLCLVGYLKIALKKFYGLMVDEMNFPTRFEHIF